MIDVQEILKYSKEITVLYTEDDLSIQEELGSIFEIYFKKVYIGNDGLEGLNLYKEHSSKLDLIISDIQMPNMDGLEMISNIRKENDEIPVIITTAFSDQEYFIKSIDCKVFRYLLKPIQEEQMDQAFLDVSKHIIERREYIRLKDEALKKTITDTQDDAISKMSNALSTPNIIFQDNKVAFVSDSFSKLFEGKNLDLKSISPSSDIFEEKEGFFTKLIQYNDNPINSKVTITNDDGNKIFRIERNLIELDNNDHISEMFVLEDITLEENMFSIF